LYEIAATTPRNLAQLAPIKGLGSSKLKRYGAAVLEVLRALSGEPAIPEPVELAKPLPVPAPAQVGNPAELRFATLRAWRSAEAARQDIPSYVIFHDATLREIADANPRNIEQLAPIKGIGASKLHLYGKTVIELLAKAT